MTFARPLNRWAKPAPRTPKPLLIPRNTRAIEQLRADGQLPPWSPIVVTFIGTTDLIAPHLYVDPGKRYDWTVARELYCTIVVRPGIDASNAIKALYDMARPGFKPALVDFESKVVGWATPAGLEVNPWQREGGSEWKNLFG
jgi:hypothetical protein